VFWANTNQDQLIRVVINGSTTPTTFAQGQSASSFTVTSTSLVTTTTDYHIVFYGLATAILDKTFGPVNAPFDIAARGDDVFWTESSSRKIWRGTQAVPANVLLSSAEDGPESIAVTSDAVYWTNYDEPGKSAVRRFTDADGAVDVVAPETAPISVVADGDVVYWLTGDGRLRRRLTSGVVETVASGFKTALDNRSPKKIAFTTTSVVWIGDGNILSAPK
jgi:hypothetical protein